MLCRPWLASRRLANLIWGVLGWFVELPIKNLMCRSPCPELRWFQVPSTNKNGQPRKWMAEKEFALSDSPIAPVALAKNWCQSYFASMHVFHSFGTSVSFMRVFHHACVPLLWDVILNGYARMQDTHYETHVWSTPITPTASAPARSMATSTTARRRATPIAK